MSESRAVALRSLLFASSAAGMLVVAPAFAAEVPAEDGVVFTAEQQQPTNLGTINVNGQLKKREPQSPEFVAPLLDTPRAVTIIPQQIIEQTAASSLQDVLMNSPGITFGAGEGGQPLADRPFIRGQSSGNNIFVDGLRDTGGQQREVFNLEQVEVIKGPDAVYSGRGSGGGSINMGSKAPQLTEFTNIGASVGTDSYLRGTIDSNMPLGGTAALRVNLMGAQGDVPGRDSVDYDKWGAAISLGAGLGTPSSMVFSYYHLTSDQMPDYGIPLFTKIGVRTTDSGILDVPYDSFYGVKGRDFLTNEVDTFTFKAEHRLNDVATIRNVSRYSETLNDYIVTNPGDGGYVGRAADGTYWMKRGTKTRWNPVTTLANVTDVYGQFATGSIKHSYDVGVELSRERNRNASYSTYTTSGSTCPTGLTTVSGSYPTASSALGAGDCTQVYNPNADDAWTGVINRGPISSNTTETIGVYANDSITLSERLILNLGVRWDQYAVDGINATVTPTQPTAGVWGTPTYTIVPKRTWEFTNYQVGLVFKPTPSSSVYASWSTSSTPPTISSGDQNASGGTGSGDLANEVLDPEDSESFEIGAKANVFSDRLALSAALFQTTRKNAIILVSGTTDYEQAGEVEVKGLELGVSGSITPAWTVFGGYTYMDSELVEGAYTSVNEGDPLANTPEHTASLFSTYRVTRKLTLGGGVYYTSKSFGGNQGGAGGGTNRIYAPEWTRVDAFASYDLTDRASLQLNVKNLTDEEYIIRTNGVHHADVAPARQAILALNLRF
ncbi:TonB-dependent receptor [Brevundimonas sp. SL130]|uniref:TonB-dependent receptor n=1 Tax=Brevundimonas sp. SL130 TaxID=2995143 RepID=UPI00226D3E70|nr:TonB-dependent siderophore receptor [Brevundimonas sp. SL130]WAC59679.1 TonB-dependent siderophore receptor [Brevundimonas sp. SL130]